MSEGDYGNEVVREDPVPVPVSGVSKAVIRKVANGFIIKVGCSEFVATTWTMAVTGLTEYWQNPRAAERKYSKCTIT